MEIFEAKGNSWICFCCITTLLLVKSTIEPQLKPIICVLEDLWFTFFPKALSGCLSSQIQFDPSKLEDILDLQGRRRAEWVYCWIVGFFCDVGKCRYIQNFGELFTHAKLHHPETIQKTQWQ